MRGPRSLKQDQALLDTEEGESVETDTNLPLKKSSSRPRKSRKNRGPDLKTIENGTWNPFERVDPKILERLHRKHERNAEKARKYFLLTSEEDAPI